MKNPYLFVVCLICLTCQDSEQRLQLAYAHLSRDVGSQITSEEADRWTNRFRQNSRSKDNSADFVIYRQHLQKMISIVEDCDGLFFYHGLVGEENHIVCVPVKNDRLLWDTIIIDCNTSEIINAHAGKQWYENYKSKNPGGPWGYFFGVGVFNEILANEFSEKISLVSAINDDHVKLLIVYSWDGDHAMGRSKDQASGAYDHSFICPSSCPQ